MPTATLLGKIKQDLKRCLFEKLEVERYLNPFLVVLLRGEPHKMEELKLISECTDCG